MCIASSICNAEREKSLTSWRCSISSQVISICLASLQEDIRKTEHMSSKIFPTVDDCTTGEQHNKLIRLKAEVLVSSDDCKCQEHRKGHTGVRTQSAMPGIIMQCFQLSRGNQLFQQMVQIPPESRICFLTWLDHFREEASFSCKEIFTLVKENDRPDMKFLEVLQTCLPNVTFDIAFFIRFLPRQSCI